MGRTRRTESKSKRTPTHAINLNAYILHNARDTILVHFQLDHFVTFFMVWQRAHIYIVVNPTVSVMVCP
jgi:hypothetical protein